MGNGIDIADVTDKIVDKIEKAQESLKSLMGKDDITPSALGDATLAVLNCDKALSSYLAMANYKAKLNKDEKLAAENEKKQKELEQQLADTKASLDKVTAEKKAGEEASNERLKKLAASLGKGLEDVEPTDIIAILDALPSYLMAESARRRKLLESKRLS